MTISTTSRKFCVGDLVKIRTVTNKSDLKKGIVVEIVSNTVCYPGAKTYQSLKVCNLAGETKTIDSAFLELLAVTEKSSEI
jgi:hypothetical protein